MNYITGSLLSLLITFNCMAETEQPALPEGFVKLTKDNNPKCVVFVIYQGERYCSLTPLDNNPVDPKLLNNPLQNIQFDNRPWKAAWGEKTPEITTVEYIVIGDDINNWKEIITSQFMPIKQVSPSELGDSFLSRLKQTGAIYTVNTIENSANQLIFEYKVLKPVNLQQDEIVKITQGKDGLYILHYAIKGADMDEANRQKWIENIKKSTLKKS